MSAPTYAKDKNTGSRIPGPSEDNGKPLNWDVDGSVALLTDYRANGVSNSDGKPSVQAALNFTSKKGWFAQVQATTVAPNGGANVELDITAGYSVKVGKGVSTVGATATIYPGAGNGNFVQFFNAYSFPVGIATVKAQVAWAPRQAQLAKSDLYLNAVASVPLKGTSIVIEGSVGRENGAFGDHKIDWSLSGTYSIGQIDLGVSYVDTHHALMPYAGPTLVASITGNF